MSVNVEKENRAHVRMGSGTVEVMAWSKLQLMRVGLEKERINEKNILKVKASIKERDSKVSLLR